MQLDYLADGSPDCPLIRLFDFTPTEARLLAIAVTDLAAGRLQRVAVHELPGVLAMGGCKLVLCLRISDQGVVKVGPMAFECGFSSGTWDNVSGLIEPFAAGGGGFQWLARAPGEAALLLSVSGEW